MALTATITLSSASCTVGQSVQCKVHVSNSAATPVTVLEIKPTCIFTGDTAARDGSSFTASPVPLSQGFNAVVAASSSADFFFSLSPYSPSVKSDNTGSGTYDVSCLVSDNTGSKISPTAATLTVHPVVPLF